MIEELVKANKLLKKPLILDVSYNPLPVMLQNPSDWGL